MNPEKYLKMSVAQQNNIKTIISEFKDELKVKYGKCMDVGCGPGNSTFELLLPALHPNATLIGIDNNEAMIEYANEKYCKSERLKFEVMNIQTTDLPADYIDAFDHIFSFHTLHWCSDFRQALSNIYRMLRLGGTALLWFKVESSLAEIVESLTNNQYWAPYQLKVGNLFRFDKTFVLETETKDFLESIGFRIHKYRQETEYCTTTWWESRLSYLIDLNIKPLISNLPDNLKMEFKEQLKEEVMKRSIDPTISDSRRKNVVAGDSTLVFAEKMIKL